MTTPVPPKRRVGRPPGPVSEKRVLEAIALLKRSDVPDAEIARHFSPDPTPEELLADLIRSGGCPPEVTLADLQLLSRDRVIRVELAPLEDGVSPVEVLVYLPDLLKAGVKELVAIRHQLQVIAGTRRSP